MKILIIGKNGQLGRSINKLTTEANLKSDFFFISRSQLNLNNQLSISDYFTDKFFDVIVNCAAYTNVDGAESDEDLSNQINHLAVEQLARIAKQKNIKFIHISTDYVFNGKAKFPYIESDSTNPLNFYGKTKLAGEDALIAALPLNGIIIRTSWLFSEFRKNFVKTIIKLAKERDELKIISDQISTPTYSDDLARVIIQIIQNDSFKKFSCKTQIYHYSNQGSCSWYEFTKKIIEFSGIECAVNPIKSIDYDRVAEIPENTLMSKEKIEKTLNIIIPKWEDSLQECIKALKIK